MTVVVDAFLQERLWTVGLTFPVLVAIFSTRTSSFGLLDMYKVARMKLSGNDRDSAAARRGMSGDSWFDGSVLGYALV